MIDETVSFLAIIAIVATIAKIAIIAALADSGPERGGRVLSRARSKNIAGADAESLRMQRRLIFTPLSENGILLSGRGAVFGRLLSYPLGESLPGVGSL